MESNYNNRDFEQFVKQNADQYRMFPSEKVWQGIDSALHTRRKWYGLGLALLLFLTGAGVTWVMISTPSSKDLKTTAQVLPADRNINEAIEPIIIAPQKKTVPVKNVNAPLVFSDEAVQTPQSNTSIDDILINTDPAIQKNNNDAVQLMPSAIRDVEATTATLVALPSQKPFKAPVVISIITRDLISFAPSATPIVPADQLSSKKTDETTEAPVAKNQTPSDNYSLTIESVINSYKRPGIKKKVSLQAYITPTVSYRKLSENKEFLRSAAAAGVVPNYAAYNDVKNYVTHKPDIGLEMGLTAKYPLSKQLLVKAGLQFNVSRYDIRAFTSPSDTATVRLNATGRDTAFSRETIYQTRNNGNHANWLQNLYFTVSIPIGAEFRFAANKKKTQLGIGATLQPTYVISDRAYLISTNYKNYIEVPGQILRRFNLNAGFEFFVDYSTNKFHWQIGPQVRYQTRSTFKDKYPVKENLFDFGLRVGVMFKK